MQTLFRLRIQMKNKKKAWGIGQKLYTYAQAQARVAELAEAGIESRIEEASIIYSSTVVYS